MSGSASRDTWKASLQKELNGRKARFSKWLRGRYLNWQIERGEPGKVIEFADHLGQSRATVAMWMSGRRLPTGSHVDLTMVRRYVRLADADITAAHHDASPVAQWEL